MLWRISVINESTFLQREPVKELLYMKNRITSANLGAEKSVRETTGIFPDSKLISWPKVGPFVTPQTWIFSGGKRGRSGKSPNPSNQKFTAVWWHTVGGGVFCSRRQGIFLYLSNVCYEKLCLFFVPAQKNTSP
jgi:hypothetical protein